MVGKLRRQEGFAKMTTCDTTASSDVLAESSKCSVEHPIKIDFLEPPILSHWDPESCGLLGLVLVWSFLKENI
jgi:hypothetical protein